MWLRSYITWTLASRHQAKDVVQLTIQRKKVQGAVEAKTPTLD